MKIKYLLLISIPILIVFSIVNIQSGELRTCGLLAIIVMFSVEGLIWYNLRSVLLLTSLIIIAEFVIRITIDLIGGYTIELDSGEILTFSDQIFSQIDRLVATLVLTTMIGGLKYFILKSRVLWSKSECLNDKGTK